MSLHGTGKRDPLGRWEARTYRRPDNSWCHKVCWIDGVPHEKLPRCRKWTPVPEAWWRHENWPDLGGETI